MLFNGGVGKERIIIYYYYCKINRLIYKDGNNYNDNNIIIMVLQMITRFKRPVHLHKTE